MIFYLIIFSVLVINEFCNSQPDSFYSIFYWSLNYPHDLTFAKQYEDKQALYIPKFLTEFVNYFSKYLSKCLESKVPVDFGQYCIKKSSSRQNKFSIQLSQGFIKESWIHSFILQSRMWRIRVRISSDCNTPTFLLLFLILLYILL